MASSLPNNPSLDRLRADARKLRRAVTAADAEAVELGRRNHPRPDLALVDTAERFALHDSQLTVARSYGFTGWPALVRYLETAADLSVDSSSIDEGALESVDRFCARLLDAGADPTLTDSRFGSTPRGWAQHAFQTEAAELLGQRTSG